MSTSKRILAGIAILLSVAGLLLSVAGGIGVWAVKEPVRARATHLFQRVEAALTVADEGLDYAKKSLATAGERLGAVKEEQKKIAQEPRSGNAPRRLMARTVQQRIAPEISNAHEKLNTVAEAAVVINSVLEDVGNFPLMSVLGLDVGDLSQINSSLSKVESSAWEFGRLFAENEPETDLTEQVSRIEQALTTMQELLTTYETKVMQVRQRTDDLKSRILRWITPATILISFACLWIALSQISMLCHAWTWWKRAGNH